MKDLNPDEILKAEFDYAKETSFQANEDRARVYNLLIANAATIIAAIALPRVEVENSSLVFSVIFFVIFLFGIVTLVQLARIRVAWVDSVKTMNKIKDFYIDEFPKLEKAFRWRTNTIPRANKTWTVAFMTAFNTIVLNSISLTALLLFLGTSLGIAILLAILTTIIQTYLWFKLLK